MPTIEPAYRTRRRDPEAYSEAVTRYAHLVESDRRRRQLVAMGPGAPVQTATAGRPAWVAPAIDWLITPGLWALAVAVSIAHPWILALYVGHLVAIALLLRLDARPGAG